jgi:prepilin-type processing-associated H-X9-DG protein
MSSIKLSAQKVKDVSNLQKIAEAWRECAINRGWRIDGKDGGICYATVFAEQLAGQGKTNSSDIVLNDPYVYISPGDKYASKVRHETLTLFNGSTIIFTSAFSVVSNIVTSGDHCFSYCFALNLPTHESLSTTPLGFTRGLREDGKWDEKSGLYGSKGGYVVFCDGHVTWFDGNRSTKFLHWNGQEYTTNVRQAVPSSAFITCGNGATKTDYKSDGSLVILRHAGAGGS